MKHITITVTSELEDIEPYLRDILTTMKDHDEVTDFSITTSTFTERPVKEHSNNKSISNQEAAEILKLMPKQSEAIKKAIEVLEQEPCEDAISRRAVMGLLDEYYAELTLDETALKSNAIAIKVTRHIINDIEALPYVNPTTNLSKIRAEIEPKCDRIYNLISIYPYAERRDIQEMLCEIMDLCDAESEHKRLIDADELLKRISEKAKTPSLSEDTVNGLCGATAIIYDMLIESGQEKDTDKESD